MSDFTVVQPDGPLYRLARVPDPWAWPDWAYAGLDGLRWDLLPLPTGGPVRQLDDL
jgi:hypothetical protein